MKRWVNEGVKGLDDKSRARKAPRVVTMEIANDIAAGGRETDRLVAVLRPNGLLYYFIGVAPEREFNRYESLFEDMIASVRFNY